MLHGVGPACRQEGLSDDKAGSSPFTRTKPKECLGFYRTLMGGRLNFFKKKPHKFVGFFISKMFFNYILKPKVNIPLIPGPMAVVSSPTSNVKSISVPM